MIELKELPISIDIGWFLWSVWIFYNLKNFSLAHKIDQLKYKLMEEGYVLEPPIEHWIEKNVRIWWTVFFWVFFCFALFCLYMSFTLLNV